MPNPGLQTLTLGWIWWQLRQVGQWTSDDHDTSSDDDGGVVGNVDDVVNRDDDNDNAADVVVSDDDDHHVVIFGNDDDNGDDDDYSNNDNSFIENIIEQAMNGRPSHLQHLPFTAGWLCHTVFSQEYHSRCYYGYHQDETYCACWSGYYVNWERVSRGCKCDRNNILVSKSCVSLIKKIC